MGIMLQFQSQPPNPRMGVPSLRPPTESAKALTNGDSIQYMPAEHQELLNRLRCPYHVTNNHCRRGGTSTKCDTPCSLRVEVLLKMVEHGQHPWH